MIVPVIAVAVIAVGLVLQVLCYLLFTNHRLKVFASDDATLLPVDAEYVIGKESGRYELHVLNKSTEDLHNIRITSVDAYGICVVVDIDVIKSEDIYINKDLSSWEQRTGRLSISGLGYLPYRVDLTQEI